MSWRLRADRAAEVARYVPVVLLALGAWARRWTSEDAFITFRVVTHLFEGHGLVFNAGERVEVYTHPLWLALLAVARLVTDQIEIVACALGLIFGVAAILIASLAGAWFHERDRPVLPLGAISFAALPPVWDFTTSGLELALVFFWLALSYALLCRLAAEPGRLPAALFCIGLGVLIRPELALMAGPLTVAAILIARDEACARPLRCLLALALVPVAYQVFRMAYFASVVPNPAIAKSAFSLYPRRGAHYLINFIRPYHLWVPAAALLAVAVITWRRVPQWRLPAAAMVFAGIMHGMYVVGIGGDFMHARLLLPGAFALALAAGGVPLSWLKTNRLLTAVAMAIAGWAVICSGWLRPPIIEHPTAQIVDERRFYVELSRVSNPVRLSDFAASGWFYDPVRHPTRNGAIYVPNIGIVGYSAGPAIRVVDVAGLADPVGARIPQPARTRAGHEKQLPVAWYLARVDPADAMPGVAAAREALSCGPLGELMQAITAPMSLSRAVRNVSVAIRTYRLRIPADPTEARRRFCEP